MLFGSVSEMLACFVCVVAYMYLLWQSIIPVAISRVNQFDAARLDVEMSAMLKEQLVKVFTLMKVFHHQSIPRASLPLYTIFI